MIALTLLTLLNVSVPNQTFKSPKCTSYTVIVWQNSAGKEFDIIQLENGHMALIKQIPDNPLPMGKIDLSAKKIGMKTVAIEGIVKPYPVLEECFPNE